MPRPTLLALVITAPFSLVVPPSAFASSEAPAPVAGEPDPKAVSSSSPTSRSGRSATPFNLESFLLAGAQHLRQSPGFQDLDLPGTPDDLRTDPGLPGPDFVPALGPGSAATSASPPTDADPDSTALRDRLDQLLAAIETYRETGEAAVVKRSTRDIFPFDESQPVLRCSLLVVCDVELEPGEVVTDVALGAPRLWDAREMVSGDPGNPTPHVIVWPLDYDLATNAVIATTRRTYHLDLVSPSKDEIVSGEVPFHRHVSFYYPAEVVRRWNELDELRRREADREKARARSAVVAPLAALDLETLTTDYTVKAPKDVHWVPTLVFDDGRQTFLRFPSHVRAGNLPTLLVETPAGSLGLANFRWSPDGRWMIYDGVFPRARLIAGVGRKQRKVEIRKATGS